LDHCPSCGFTPLREEHRDGLESALILSAYTYREKFDGYEYSVTFKTLEEMTAFMEKQRKEKS
jgi:hypothetical protein